MIEIKNISKQYSGIQIFKDFNLNIKEGEITCILGKSGCGKTTLLNMISKLIQYDEGSIEGIENSDFSYIFQETRLIPWLTIEENISFILESKFRKKEAKNIIKYYLEFVNLYEYKDYFPKQLSGGMKQRVSIARAFAYPSDILLMDEPFKGLDFQLKQSLIKDFIDLWRKDKRTIVFVTHELNEALLLADIIHILNGRPVYIKDTIHIRQSQNIRKLDNREIKTFKNRIIDRIKKG